MDLRVKFPLLLLIAASLAMTPAQTGAASSSRHDRGADVETSLLILGDAGVGQSTDDPVLRPLADAVRLDPDRTSVLFLGDNVSPDGVPVEGHRRRAGAERRLRAQVEASQGANRVIFVPGNHDGAQHGDPRDWEAAGRQARLLAATGIAEMRPAAGCPAGARSNRRARPSSRAGVRVSCASTSCAAGRRLTAFTLTGRGSVRRAYERRLG